MTNQLPQIPEDRSDDLHGLDYADTADLVLFMAGNQFMVMEALLTEFQKQFPEVKKIFYETLPPGLELKQIIAGGASFRGKALTVYPDIYTSVNLTAMQTLENAGHIENGGYQLYLHNRLTLMVPEENPANIQSVPDLGREEIRISQPDPQNEDIAFHIMELDFEVVEPGEELDQRHKINYYVCRLIKAPHPENAHKFMQFVCTPTAQNIYKEFGFVAHLA
jgi:ABC-type molybdate transport system substrate-binding protein